MRRNIFYFGTLSMLLLACSGDSGALFERLPSEKTGIRFVNQLEFDEDFNVYTYRNYYNGGGVSIGDVNNDGWQDLYFTSNLKENKLFLNKGNWEFEDVTEKAGVAGTRAWSTGVTMVDVNADGWLDIYVCNSGDIEGDNKQNELFINNGDLTFTESAADYGLDDGGYSTHASFFDYDRDGDLDAYLLNNSYQAIGSFDLRRNERPKRDTLGGDKLLRNTEGIFEDVSEEAGIYGSVIGFGLGVTVGDVNGDSWDDIYVSNDFFERDYLYINQQDGTFKEDLINQMNSISGASMGADLADINNDGNNDLFVTEMLPRDYERLKSVTTFEDWNRYQYNVENGYYHQFTRNTFQLNNGDNTFSEIGRLAGVEATDWSWGALIFDMDNDGLKDLFVANGIYQDLTDQDYLQYISNEEVVKSIVSKQGVDYKRLVEIIPSNPIPNYAFHNQGDLGFANKTEEFGLADEGFSNGAAYGDLDNDGDLDLVVNNVNGEAFIYRSNADKIGGNYLKFSLIGEGQNPYAIGAKITVQSGEDRYYVELQPTRGFQSSMDFRPNLGLKTDEPVAVTIVWPNGAVTRLTDVPVNQTLEASMADATESFVTSAGSKAVFQPTAVPLTWSHKENTYVDFHRDRLQYHMKSTEGPKMSSGDIDGDGVTDLFVGGAKENIGALLMGMATGYTEGNASFLEEHSISEDMGSALFDADGDGDLDLYVCSGGVEYSRSSSALLDRIYFNDGSGGFDRSARVFVEGNQFTSTSVVAPADIDGDGDVDLFVGERSKPFLYGTTCSGFILINDGSGNFQDMTQDLAPSLSDIGMITAGGWLDLDGDNDLDLVLTGEYMGVHFLQNSEGRLELVDMSVPASLKGWWNEMRVDDIDGDGDMDVLLGNHGLNSRFRASADEPIKLFVADFDENGSLDPVLSGYSEDGILRPFALRHDLIDQMKGLKKLFPDYESFKGKSMQEIFGEATLAEAITLEVNELRSGVLLNDGDWKFRFQPFPMKAQLYPVFAIATSDFDGDGDMDVLLGGNLYGTKPEVGRYDAGFGTYLENDGTGRFSVVEAGFKVKGEIRDLEVVGNKVVVARNNDSLVFFEY